MSRSDTEPFSLDIRCSGNLREYYTVKDECGEVHSNLIRRDCPWTGAGMLDTLEAYKRRCDFTYKLAVYYPESGDYRYKKILNGRDIDVLASGTPAILDKPVTDEWRGDFLNLWAEFDFEKYPEKLAELRRIVRECVPEEELGYCEDEWGDREGEMLCSGVTWNTKDLHEIQRFLDKLNAVLLPLGDEVKAGGDGNWEIRDEFAVAAWNWTDEGFKVLGLCY